MIQHMKCFNIPRKNILNLWNEEEDKETAALLIIEHCNCIHRLKLIYSRIRNSLEIWVKYVWCPHWLWNELYQLRFSQSMMSNLVLISLQQWSNIQRSQQILKFVHDGCTAWIYHSESSYISLLVIHTCCAAVVLGRKCLGLVYEEDLRKGVCHACKNKANCQNCF